MKKENSTPVTSSKSLNNLTDIKPLTEIQVSEVKGGAYYYCCTDKRRPIRVRYSYYY